MRLTTIDDLMSNPARSRHREYLITTQFIKDMVLAAGHAGYDLLVYLPTVDSDGFDVILDDRHRLVPLQLKSAVQGGKTASWSVHKTLLWPDVDDANLYGLNPDWSQHGRSGGVVLVRAGLQDEQLTPRYAYTDIDVLAAMWYEVWPLPVPQRKRVDRLQKELSDESTLKVDLPRSAFLPVATADHLLALAGLTSNIEDGWRSSLRSALRSKKEGIPYGDLDPDRRRWAHSDLQRLVCKPISQLPRNARERGRQAFREIDQTLYRMDRLVDEKPSGNDESRRKK
jgi:hypothetical protein